MNKKNLKYTFAVLFAASSFALADDAKIQYFDCWMENIDKIDSSELKRLNIQPKQFSNSTWLCGCYSVEERGGYGWRYGDGSPKITKIWDLPKFDLYSCRTRSCTEGNGEFNDNLDQCVSYLNSTGFNLSNFDEGKSLNKAIAQKFADDGSLTDFGHYFKNRMDRLDKIPCFFQYHGRPDAAKFADWDRKGVFSISGLPPKFLPAAIGRFTDYSDVRCKDGLEWTGFASNGYIENIMHVDSTGKFHGTETGFGMILGSRFARVQSLGVCCGLPNIGMVRRMVLLSSSVTVLSKMWSVPIAILQIAKTAITLCTSMSLTGTELFMVL